MTYSALSACKEQRRREKSTTTTTDEEERDDVDGDAVALPFFFALFSLFFFNAFPSAQQREKDAAFQRIKHHYNVPPMPPPAIRTLGDRLGSSLFGIGVDLGCGVALFSLALSSTAPTAEGASAIARVATRPPRQLRGEAEGDKEATARPIAPRGRRHDERDDVGAVVDVIGDDVAAIEDDGDNDDLEALEAEARPTAAWSGMALDQRRPRGVEKKEKNARKKVKRRERFFFLL